MKITTVIFDMDGTILNTLADVSGSINATLHAFGYPTHSVDRIRQMIGAGIGNTFAKALPKEAVTEEIIQQMVHFYRKNYRENNYKQTQPYPGIIELMQKLQELGYKMAIVSNKGHQDVVKLAQQFFQDYVQIAVGLVPERKEKPAPDSVNYALELMEISAAEAIYIGDSEVDIETAKNAFMPGVGVSWGFRGRAFLEDCQAQYIIDTPMELIDILEKENA